MQYATALGSPAFGQTLKSFDDTAARKVNGVTDVFKIKVPRKEEDRFVDKVVVTATSTWAAIKGQRALSAEWGAGKQARELRLPRPDLAHVAR